LLVALPIGFAASNRVVGLSSSYAVVIAFRIVGGIYAGVLWPTTVLRGRSPRTSCHFRRDRTSIARVFVLTRQ